MDSLTINKIFLKFVKIMQLYICDFFKNAGWNKIEIFNTGDEILELEKYNK